MQTYEIVKIEVLFFTKSDVIRTSGEGTVDDNYNWLEQ